MELTAKYVYKVYQERSFSKAAEDLFISQPALSAAISRLEKEIGIRIFDRTTVPLSLTAQGRIYIEALEEIMQSESNMRRKIRELSDMSYGSLTIGGSSSSSYFILPQLCKEFYKNFPEIKITLDIGNIGSGSNLFEKLKSRDIDIVISYTYDSKDFFAVPLIEERLIIAISKKMQGAEKLAHLALSYDEIVSGSYDKNREIDDISVFKDIGFFEFQKNANTTRRMAQILGDYKNAPYHIENARHGGVHYNMMCTGIGAVLTTDTLISSTPYNSDDILFFVPKCRESYRTVYLVGNKDTKNNPIANNFIKTAKELYRNKKFLRE